MSEVNVNNVLVRLFKKNSSSAHIVHGWKKHVKYKTKLHVSISDSLVADPDFGSILSSLLVGPCALDYSRAKTPEHFWTDPPADELIQRHRISSGNPTPPSCRRPIMNFKRSLHSSEDGSTSSFKSSSSATAAKDYVESLHQNSRATLLYGKNNVLVLPVCKIHDKVNKSFYLITYACIPIYLIEWNSVKWTFRCR